MNRIQIGKRLGNITYVHRLYYKVLRLPRYLIDAFLHAIHEQGWVDYDIIKYHFSRSRKQLTAIWVDDFDGKYEPEIVKSLVVTFKRRGIVDVTAGYTTGKITEKYKLVEPNYPGFDYEVAKLRAEWLKHHSLDIDWYEWVAPQLGYCCSYEASSILDGIEEETTHTVDCENSSQGNCSIPGCTNTCDYVRDSKRRKNCCLHSSSKKEPCEGCGE